MNTRGEAATHEQPSHRDDKGAGTGAEAGTHATDCTAKVSERGANGVWDRPYGPGDPRPVYSITNHAPSWMQSWGITVWHVWHAEALCVVLVIYRLGTNESD